MSDEAFAELPLPEDELFEEPESVSDSGADEGVEEEQESDEPEELESDEDEEGDFDETSEEEDDSEEETDEDAETDDTDSDESDENESDSDDSKVDYESFYKALTAPFKANGKDMQVDNPEDAVRLMQMGANYNKKMASLKPNLKMMKMLDNNGLLDERKLSFLIDLDKKNPDAIKKLVKDSGIDSYEIDDNDPDYKPNNYSVGDKEYDLSEALNEIKQTDTYSKTLNVVNKEWDSESQSIIADNPETLLALNEHIANGLYDRIATEVEKDRMLGRLSGVSDIEAYRLVGNRLFEQGNFNEETPKTQESPEPTQTPSKSKKPANAKRKRAAASPRSSKASTPTSHINPLNMSDEEFEKEFSDKFL